MVRCDKGTENSILAACHMTMRHHHDDELQGEKSFRYGPSTTNTVSIMNLWFMFNIKVCFYNTIYSGLKVGGLSYVAP